MIKSAVNSIPRTVLVLAAVQDDLERVNELPELGEVILVAGLRLWSEFEHERLWQTSSRLVEPL